MANNNNTGNNTNGSNGNNSGSNQKRTNSKIEQKTLLTAEDLLSKDQIKEPLNDNPFLNQTSSIEVEFDTQSLNGQVNEELSLDAKYHSVNIPSGVVDTDVEQNLQDDANKDNDTNILNRVIDKNFQPAKRLNHSKDIPITHIIETKFLYSSMVEYGGYANADQLFHCYISKKHSPMLNIILHNNELNKIVTDKLLPHIFLPFKQNMQDKTKKDSNHRVVTKNSISKTPERSVFETNTGIKDAINKKVINLAIKDVPDEDQKKLVKSRLERSTSTDGQDEFLLLFHTIISKYFLALNLLEADDCRLHVMQTLDFNSVKENYRNFEQCIDLYHDMPNMYKLFELEQLVSSDPFLKSFRNREMVVTEDLARKVLEKLYNHLRDNLAMSILSKTDLKPFLDIRSKQLNNRLLTDDEKEVVESSPYNLMCKVYDLNVWAQEFGNPEEPVSTPSYLLIKRMDRIYEVMSKHNLIDDVRVVASKVDVKHAANNRLTYIKGRYSVNEPQIGIYNEYDYGSFTRMSKLDTRLHNIHINVKEVLRRAQSLIIDYPQVMLQEHKRMIRNELDILAHDIPFHLMNKNVASLFFVTEGDLVAFFLANGGKLQYGRSRSVSGTLNTDRYIVDDPNKKIKVFDQDNSTIEYDDPTEDFGLYFTMENVTPLHPIDETLQHRDFTCASIYEMIPYFREKMGSELVDLSYRNVPKGDFIVQSKTLPTCYKVVDIKKVNLSIIYKNMDQDNNLLGERQLLSFRYDPSEFIDVDLNIIGEKTARKALTSAQILGEPRLRVVTDSFHTMTRKYVAHLALVRDYMKSHFQTLCTKFDITITDTDILHNLVDSHTVTNINLDFLKVAPLDLEKYRQRLIGLATRGFRVKQMKNIVTFCQSITQHPDVQRLADSLNLNLKSSYLEDRPSEYMIKDLRSKLLSFIIVAKSNSDQIIDTILDDAQIIYDELSKPNSALVTEFLMNYEDRIN